jgi:hypothetical protein
VLYITDCGALLSKLQELNSADRLNIPLTPAGLGKRLRSTSFAGFVFLEEDSAPDLAVLKRTHKRRPIGFFIEDDRQ